MGSSVADLFGSNVKLLSLQSNPPAVPNEQDLLAAVVAKVGPFADEKKLLYHIRVSAGKVHWAVNSYLRSILASSAPIREDFDSRSCQAQRLPAAGHISIAATVHQNGQLLTDQPHMAAVPVLAIRQPTIAAAQQCQWDLAGANSNPLCSSSAAPCATAALMPAAAPNALTLQSLPASVLDSVLALLDLQSLVCAANSCRALYKTAQSDSIWRRLFGQRWGSVIFPISKYGKSRDCSNTGSQQVAAQETANTWRTAAAAGQVQTHRADAHSADVLHDGRLGTKTAAPANAGTAAAGANPGSAGSNSNPAFVSRWTGSSTFPDLNTDSCALERAPAAEISTVAAKSSGSGAGRSQHVSHSKIEHNTCSCSSCACVPAVARCGSWQFQYKQQHSYQAARKCPMCGAATVVPVVYGFPSGPLLAGMAKKRLLLGGDHLIDSDVQRWLQDDEAQQQLDQARSAAGRGSRHDTAAAAEEEGGDGVVHQQGGIADGDRITGADGDYAGAMGFPRYTYEL